MNRPDPHVHRLDFAEQASVDRVASYADTTKLTALFTALQPLAVRAAENEVAAMEREAPDAVLPADARPEEREPERWDRLS